jgi:hypothetical protein
LIGPSHLSFPYLTPLHGGGKLFLNKFSGLKDLFGKAPRIFEETKKLNRDATNVPSFPQGTLKPNWRTCCALKVVRKGMF